MSEIREYRIPFAALAEGGAIVLDRVPAGTTVLWLPRLTPAGEISMAVALPATADTQTPDIRIR